VPRRDGAIFLPSNGGAVLRKKYLSAERACSYAILNMPLIGRLYARQHKKVQKNHSDTSLCQECEFVVRLAASNRFEFRKLLVEEDAGSVCVFNN
jgi:hypothetical protein